MTAFRNLKMQFSIGLVSLNQLLSVSRPILAKLSNEIAIPKRFPIVLGWSFISEIRTALLVNIQFKTSSLLRLRLSLSRSQQKSVQKIVHGMKQNQGYLLTRTSYKRRRRISL